MRTLRSIVLCLLLSVLSACVLSGEAIEGQVLEQGTGRPIPGAIVVARWRGDLFAFVTTQSVCVQVETATTDTQGRYRLPAWRKKSDIGWVRNIFPVLIVYKKDYRQTENYRNSMQYLQPFTGTSEERFEYLSRLAASCSDRQEIEINLLPLYKALYEEARTLAATKDERLKALYRLRDVERLELGSDQAWENFRKRERELK